jgi:hypothetical protein
MDAAGKSFNVSSVVVEQSSEPEARNHSSIAVVLSFVRGLSVLGKHLVSAIPPTATPTEILARLFTRVLPMMKDYIPR